MVFLDLQELFKQEGENTVLYPLHFTMQEGERVAIAGETGSGKSTLLKLIAGLVQPTGGNVYFEGMRVLGPDEQLLPGHPRIAYLSQHYELRNNYKVHELLSMTNQLDYRSAQQIFEVCRIAHLMMRRSDELSGGEKQRIALAKQLTSYPKLLLLDEPFSNLDRVHKALIRSVIDDICDTGGTLAKSASLLKEKGARSVRALCTHPVLSGKAYENIENSVLEEFYGTLEGELDNGVKYTIECTRTPGDIVLKIETTEETIEINESKGLMSSQGKEEKFFFPYQSQLTNLVVDDLLSDCRCDLTTLQDTRRCNEIFLDKFLEKFNLITGEKALLLPIT